MARPGLAALQYEVSYKSISVNYLFFEYQSPVALLEFVTLENDFERQLEY